MSLAVPAGAVALSYAGRHRTPAATSPLSTPLSLSAAALTASAFVVSSAASSDGILASARSAGDAVTTAFTMRPVEAGTQVAAAPEAATIPAAAPVAAGQAAAPAKAVSNVVAGPQVNLLTQTRAGRKAFAAATSLAKTGTRLAGAALAASAQTWVSPVSGTHQTSDFGPRWGRMHKGNDYAGPIGTPLKSLSSGTIIFAGQQSGYGNKVEIRFWDGTVAYYGHMSSIAVKVGDRVSPGSVVGALGNSGRSTGPHLHLEIHPAGGEAIDPSPWLAKMGIKVA